MSTQPSSNTATTNIPFFKVLFATLCNREWVFNLFNTHSFSSSSIYRSYLLPLAFLPSVTFTLFSLLEPEAPSLGAITFRVLMMFAISFIILHIWSLIVEGLLVAQNIEVSREKALKVTAVCASPWFFVFSLFPLIFGFCILGAIWVGTIMRPTIESLADVPKEKSLRLAAAICLMWIGLYLFSNLFFIGVLSIAGG